jgi:hypothetical protein
MTFLRHEKLTPLGKVCVILLACWALAVIIPDFWRVYGTFGSLGFEANNDGIVTDVSSPGRVVPPIAVGDRIDLKRTRLKDLLEAYAGMGGMQYVPLGQVNHFYIFSGSAGNKPSELHTAYAEPHPLDLETRIPLFLDQCFGVFFILLAAFLLLKRPSAMTLGFFLFALWYNPGQAYVSYILLERWPWALVAQEFLQAIVQSLGYIGFAIFALRFPEGRVTGWRKWIERSLPFLAVYLLAVHFWSFGTILGLHTEFVTSLAYISGYALDILIIVALVARLREEKPIERQRMKWVLFGCMVGLPAFIFADSNESTSLWDAVYQVFRLPTPSEAVLDYFYMVNAAVAFAVAYAVLRHRVIDVRIVLRRALARSIVWVIVGVGLIQTIMFIEDRVRGRLQTLFFVTLIIFISLLFEWLHERINERIDEIIFRHLHHAAEHLARVEAALMKAADPDEIESLLIGEPAAALQLGSAAVFRRDEDGTFRQHVPAVGWANTSFELELSDPIVKRIGVDFGPQRVSSARFAKQVTSETGQPALAIPIFCQKVLVAVALYGLHQRGDDFEQREIDCLEKLGLSASASYEQYENEKLRRLLAEMEAKLAKSHSRGRRTPHPGRA